MKLINVNAFITSLITLSAVAIPAVVNAQFAPSNCNPTQNINYQLDIQSDKAVSTPCIQNSVETIYNPNPNWQPNL